jgi:malonyl-CoA O-methyltransferase
MAGMINKMTPLLDRRAAIAGFNRAAGQYDQAAVLQREVADRLFDRLEWVKIEPLTILDIGARTGYTTRFLCQKFPQAQVIATDWAENLLKPAAGAPDVLRVCADPERLPLPSQIADLIIANLTWHWQDDHGRCLREWRRLLKPGGLLLFTTCGPDTFYELRASFATVDEQAHVHLFLDMHDIGDAMMAAQFADPVMQAEHLCFTYSSPAKLFRDLRGTGVTNALQSRRRSLTGKNRWQRMLSEYDKFSTPENGWPATVEVIYGLGWAAGEDLPGSHQDERGEVVVPLSHIRRRNDE